MVHFILFIYLFLYIIPDVSEVTTISQTQEKNLREMIKLDLVRGLNKFKKFQRGSQYNLGEK